MPEPTYEMLWDCGYCGAAKLLGKTHRHCPSCGAAQDENRRYFPKAHERIAVHDHVYVGADRDCPACAAPMSAAAAHCTNCGSPLEQAVEVRRIQTGESVKEIQFAHQIDSPKNQENPAAPQHHKPAHAPKTKKQKLRALLWGLGIGCGLLTCLVLLFVWDRPATMQVVGHSWERKISIEVYRAQNDGAWCDSMPMGAYNVSRDRQVRSTRQIPDGETCHEVQSDNGDGTFSVRTVCNTKYRSEDVYDDYCRFTIDRWVHDRYAANNGTSQQPSPTWPSISIKTCTTKGCEREGPRSEEYTVHFEQTDTKKAHTCAYPQDRWNTLQPQSTWIMDVGVVAKDARCDSLRPK